MAERCTAPAKKSPAVQIVCSYPFVSSGHGALGWHGRSHEVLCRLTRMHAELAIGNSGLGDCNLSQQGTSNAKADRVAFDNYVC
jgi:hypothetical protein